MSNSIDSIKTQLAQLKELHASGVVPLAQFEEGKATLERRILDLVLAPPAAAPEAPVPAATAVPAPPGAPQPTAARRRSSKRLLAVLAPVVLALAAAGYWWKGSPTQLRGAANAAQEAQDPGADPSAPHAVSSEQIAAMTDKLQARLKAQPDDVDGWAMLARTYDVLQRHPDALKAYEKALALRKDDPALMADYADSLAVNNGGNLEGEPIKLLNKALALDPKNLKALALAGTYDYNKKDYANAVKHWEAAVQAGPAENIFVKQIVPGLVEARKLAGLPPAAEPLDAVTRPAPAKSSATVGGTVKLAANLAKQVQPDDTVFIFARPAEGSRMPLAIMRRQVKDLPIQFTLDDSMAMSPSTALSGASKVIVGARISKSGNAMPQAGDLQGLSAAVAVGASKVQIEIKDVVKP